MKTMLAFEKQLQTARTSKELNKLLEAYLLSFNINTFAFTYYSYYPNSLNKIKYEITSDNFLIWHNHYVAEGYEETDSTMDVVYQTTLPIFWDIQSQLLTAKNDKERRMREDSLAYGVEKGISIPIHGPQEDFAILLLAQMRGQTCLENIADKQYSFFTAAYYFYHYLQKQLLLEQPNTPKFNLNAREIQCLTLLAKQYSITAIAKDLRITERTVNYHIQRLNRKLGTQNKYQSVIKALQQGLIK